MIYRDQLRTVYNTTETTKDTLSIASDALSFEMTTSDYFYMGFHSPFCSRYFYFDTVNTVDVDITLKYWDGGDWVAVQDLIDQTEGFSQSGFIGWQNQSDWKKSTLSPITDVELYWVRLNVSDNLITGTSLQAVLNLFCETSDLRALYPELISDTRYLPPDRTDFVEQLNAGKNMVVEKLIQKDAIESESQILDINEVKTAAVHATAYCILNGIPNPSEDLMARKKDIKEEFNDWLDRTAHSFDADEDGIVDTAEEKRTFVFRPRR